jgi:hypothetical protein
MKIAAFNKRDAANVPRELVLRNSFTDETAYGPDGKPLIIWVYGAQSDRSRNAHKARERKSGRKGELSDEENARIGAEYLAAITQGWSDNWEDDEGNKVEYTPENAVSLYLANDGIADQVIAFALDITNYDPKK